MKHSESDSVKQRVAFLKNQFQKGMENPEKETKYHENRNHSKVAKRRSGNTGIPPWPMKLKSNMIIAIHPGFSSIVFYRKALNCAVLSALFLTLFSMKVSAQNLQTVPYVDLERYAGKWYEIASFPQSFQKGCCGTTAQYTPTEKGYVIVENRCNKDSLDGKQSYIKGKAFVVKNSGNAKLKVQFFWPFRSKYWIVDLADDYSYAVVSHPNKKYLWILSRTPTMEDSLYQEIIERLNTMGLDITKLQRTKQQ